VTVPKALQVAPTTSGTARLTDSLAGAGSTSEAERPLPDHPAPGAWSVTVEIHEADDPAQSKRVLRIARLHFKTYAEAREIAGKLQREF
jgi:hypothetical protein